MTDDSDELDKRLAHLLEEGRQEDPEEHPGPDKLSAYYANELRPEEADAIQEHLAECTFCADLLLDLESSLESPAKEKEEEHAREGVADLGTEAGWRRVREGMEWKGERGRQEVAAAEVSRLRRRLRMVESIAAVLLVGVVGLGVYAVRAPRPLPERESEPNAPWVYLPSMLHVRGADSRKTMEVSPEAERVFLRFDASTVEDFPRYRLTISRKPAGERILLEENLAKSKDEFSLSLRSSKLPPGLYEIRIEGLRNGVPTLLGRYELVVRQTSPESGLKLP